SLDEARVQLEHMDGVMVGREAYQNPGILASVDREIFGVAGADADPVAVVRAMYPYIERELSKGTYLGHITRHMLGLFQGIPGARLVVIPNHMDDSKIPVNPQKEPSETVIYLARYSEEKQHLTLFNAFRKVSAQRPDARLHTYGVGPLRRKLSAQL
ncbi:tRNA-dihydrouridine synthase, partial [Pseudomonas aeruginosa]|nr:tRNA-dihydrouridine synthase [Pseudomonas aeruginosa]